MRNSIILVLISFTATAQTVTMPTWLVDSMIFEVSKGRQCSVVLQAQQVELEKQGLELVATGKALELSQKQTEIVSGLLENSKQSQEILTQQFNQDRKALRKKVRIRNLIIGGQLVLILIILL